MPFSASIGLILGLLVIVVPKLVDLAMSAITTVVVWTTRALAMILLFSFTIL